MSQPLSLSKDFRHEAADVTSTARMRLDYSPASKGGTLKINVVHDMSAVTVGYDLTIKWSPKRGTEAYRRPILKVKTGGDNSLLGHPMKLAADIDVFHQLLGDIIKKSGLNTLIVAEGWGGSAIPDGPKVEQSAAVAYTNAFNKAVALMAEQFEEVEQADEESGRVILVGNFDDEFLGRVVEKLRERGYEAQVETPQDSPQEEWNEDYGPVRVDAEDPDDRIRRLIREVLDQRLKSAGQKRPG